MNCMYVDPCGAICKMQANSFIRISLENYGDLSLDLCAYHEKFSKTTYGNLCLGSCKELNSRYLRHSLSSDCKPGEVTEHFKTITKLVEEERQRQGELHPGKTPRHNSDLFRNYTITGEEFGELAQAIQDEDSEAIVDEAVQTIACLYAMLEGMIERGDIEIEESSL